MRCSTTLTPSIMLLGVLALASVADAGQVGRPGRVDFDFDGAPPANLEVDLKRGMLSAITDIVTAAVDGAAEGINESGDGDAIRESTEIMGALREILGLTSEVVHEVRLRMYEGHDGESRGKEVGLQKHAAMLKHYRDKLEDSDWETVVRVRQGSESVSVCVQREASAIRGVFVMVLENDELVLANVVCELTPDRIKQLTNRATKIGMKFGLGDVIEQAMRELH